MSTWPLTPLPEPHVEVGGLVLRAWRPGDEADLAAAWADDQIRRWTDPPAGGVAEAQRWITGEARRRAEAAALDVVIEESGRVAAEVGFSGFHQRPHTAVVGYWVAPWARGRGLAARSLELVLDWAVENIDLRAALALTRSANTASVRTLERCGFEILAETGDDSLVYSWRSGVSEDDGAR